MRGSIVIATHNEGAALSRTIESCIETTIDVGCEIVVSDDASQDGSVAEAERRFGIDDLFLRDDAGRPVDSQNVPHCMPMWRASLHQRYGTFDPRSFGPIADWEFWIRCASGGARIPGTQ